MKRIIGLAAVAALAALAPAQAETCQRFGSSAA